MTPGLSHHSFHLSLGLPLTEFLQSPPTRLNLHGFPCKWRFKGRRNSNDISHAAKHLLHIPVTYKRKQESKHKGRKFHITIAVIILSKPVVHQCVKPMHQCISGHMYCKQCFQCNPGATRKDIHQITHTNQTNKSKTKIITYVQILHGATDRDIYNR